MNLLRGRRRPLAIALAAVGAAGAALWFTAWRDGQGPLPSFEEQACALPPEWLQRIRNGYFEPRSGQISILPKTPAYMTHAQGGWTHAGPWPYLQDIPIVVYGPGFVQAQDAVERPATLADIAPTIGALMKGVIQTEDGAILREAVPFDDRLLTRPSPRLVVTVVWDGGGWNVLNQWPDAWPNLRRVIDDGVVYTRATVGSSPSVTPSAHTTIGTAFFPSTHGITGIRVRDDSGEVVDSFLNGRSSRFIEIPTVAERWDMQNDNRAHVGMIGYEPWHLGMIGQGAERAGGDPDDAVWLDVETNDWISNPTHYRLPRAVADTGGLQEDLDRLDAADGERDGAWADHDILDDPARIEETPAFIAYHTRALMNLIAQDGYGADEITDLLFTNYKQIDRLGHYFNMASDEVREAVVETDRQLGVLLDFLDREVGQRNWVLILTADHGQQPDAPAVDGYGINPDEIEKDIEREFGAPLAEQVWATEVFLDDEALASADVAVDDVARFIGDYRLRDNTDRPDREIAGAGRFDPDDRLFDMAIPASLLPELSCGPLPRPPRRDDPSP